MFREWLAFGVLLVGCYSTEEPVAPSGFSHQRVAIPGEQTAGDPTAVATDTPWAEFDEQMSWPLVGAAFPTQHGPGSALGRVRVSPAQAERYRRWSRGMEMPVGFTALEEVVRSEGSPPHQVLVAQRRETGWSFHVLSPEGRLLESDPQRLCQRCHSDATSGSLFGLGTTTGNASEEPPRP